MPSHVPSTTFQRPSLDVNFGDGWAVRRAVAGDCASALCRVRCACYDPPSDLAGVVADDTVESSDDPPQRGTDEGEEMPKSETVLRGRLPSGGGVQQQEGAMDDGELAEVCLKLREAVALREKYRMPAEREPPGASGPVKAAQNPGNVRGWPFVAPPWAGEPGLRFELQRGVMSVWQEAPPMAEAGSPKRRPFLPASKPPPVFARPPSFEAFTADLQRLLQLCADTTVNSFCYKRLQKLEVSPARLELTRAHTSSARAHASSTRAPRELTRAPPPPARPSGQLFNACHGERAGRGGRAARSAAPRLLQHSQGGLTGARRRTQPEAPAALHQEEDEGAAARRRPWA